MVFAFVHFTLRGLILHFFSDKRLMYVFLFPEKQRCTSCFVCTVFWCLCFGLIGLQKRCEALRGREACFALRTRLLFGPGCRRGRPRRLSMILSRRGLRTYRARWSCLGSVLCGKLCLSLVRTEDNASPSQWLKIGYGYEYGRFFFSAHFVTILNRICHLGCFVYLQVELKACNCCSQMSSVSFH